jgi:hypothetical protein
LPDVVNNMLVAYTPGFSSFTPAILNYIPKRAIHGPDQLRPNMRATYYVGESSDYLYRKTHAALWILHGNSAQITTDTSRLNVTLKSLDKAGEVALSVSFYDDTSAHPFFRQKTIRIVEPDPADPFTVGLTTNRAVLYVSDNQPSDLALLTAEVYGSYSAPLTWSWDFGGGDSGVQSTNTAEFTLPQKHFPTPILNVAYHTVSLVVSDAAGTSVAVSFVFDVRLYSLETTISGPDELAMGSYDTSVSGDYTAITLGGNAPYTYDWFLKPANWIDTDGLAQQHLTFDQPGEHLLRVETSDFISNTVASTKTVLVDGGAALSATIRDLPATQRANTATTVTFLASGGVLVAAGKKGGYVIDIDWGDGSPLVTERDVLLTGLPSQGIALPMMHSFESAGDKTVKLTVTDVTGHSASYTQQISISAPSDVGNPAFGTPSAAMCPATFFNGSINTPEDYVFDSFRIVVDNAYSHQAECYYVSPSSSSHGSLYISWDHVADLDQYALVCNDAQTDSWLYNVFNQNWGAYSNLRTVSVFWSSYQSDETGLTTALTSALQGFVNAGVGEPCVY